MTKKKEERLIEFTKEQLSAILPKIIDFTAKELETEISSLQARMLLNFFTDEIGDYYYNKGVDDSIFTMSQKVEDLYMLIRM